MSEYACGHDSEPAFMTNNILSLTAYFVWKESVGYEGDNSQCWKCYCKEVNNEAT